MAKTPDHEVPEAPRITVTLMGQTYNEVRLAFQEYVDPAAGVALVAYWFDAEEGYEDQLGVISVNLREYGFTPAEGCIFIRDYEPGSDWLSSLVRAGVAEPTGRIEYGGYMDSVAFPEVRFIGDWADRALQARIEGNAQRARTVADSGSKGA
jgi:hypothetical protein